MKIMKILSWALRIIVFLLILVLVLDNMQITDFNLFGIYHIKLPMIVLLLIFFVIGVLLGLLFGIIRGYASKSDVRKLEKEIISLKAEKAQN